VAEITLGDLLRWDRGYVYVPPAGQPPTTGLDTVITWAVTIRATAPILPAIRGGEIVIIPPRLLEAIESSESIDRVALLRTIARQPVAALLVDPSFEESPIDDTPMILSGGIAQSETESMLNRLLTERRAELYRLGSDLSRALSTASMIGAGLDALLDAANAMCRRPLLLFGPEGELLASSMQDSNNSILPPMALVELTQNNASVRQIGPAAAPWLVQSFDVSPGRGITRQRHILAVGVSAESSHETERLVLSHVANAATVLIGQAASHGDSSMASSRMNREAMLTELLLGRQVSREAPDARARLLGLDPAEPARVALIRMKNAGLASRSRGQISNKRGRATASLNDQEFAVVMTGQHRDAADLRDLRAAFRVLHSVDASVTMVISGVIDGVAASRSALEQARVAARLIDHKAIDGPIVHLDDVVAMGMHGLFLPLISDGDDARIWQARLRDFADKLIAPLAEHDVRRSSELIATLAAFLRSGGALALAAEDLGVHRNTLSYRIGRIEELTGRSLADPRTRYLLQNALDARTLLMALAE